MSSITKVTLEVSDLAAAQAFYSSFDVGSWLELRQTDSTASGFRGATVSLVVAQPGNVDAWISAAVEAGATTLKPAKKSFWGYGGVVQAPDGTIWKVASTAKKDSGPTSRTYDQVVVLLGVADMSATKRFYVEHGLTVGKSYGRKYVEFETPSAQVKLALYGRRALAKDAGVPEDGSGSHRLVLGGSIGSLSDPDGFVWEAA